MPFVSNPTLALGANGLADGTPQMPYLDLMKQSRAWKAELEGDDLEYPALKAGGYIDANGWPTHMPPGASNIQTLWDFSAGTPGAEGPWVLTYVGSGTLNIHWATVTDTSDHRIEFTNDGGDLFFMTITATDPSETGDYIRDISIVPAEYEALADAGEIFRPEFLAAISPARQLRFMDWMLTNHSTQGVWADRPKASDYSWNLSGSPLEVMVELANKIGADPYFCMPHLANEEYIENFATYVRDNLNAGLVAYVTYSNETWNFNFAQNWYLTFKGCEEWGRFQGVTTDGSGYSIGATSITLAAGGTGGAVSAGNRLRIGTAANNTVREVATGLADVATGGTITFTEPLDIAIPATTPIYENLGGSEYVQQSGKHSVMVAQIWDTVFGGEAATRLNHVIEVQAGYQAIAEAAVRAPTWEDKEPGSFIAPYSVMDSLAVTTYFGGQHVSNETLRTELLAQIDAHTGDIETAYAWLTDRLINRADIEWSVPYCINNWVFFRDLCDDLDLDLTAYEGGSHEHHSAFTSVSEPDRLKLMNFYVGWSYSPYIADVYEAMWDGWAATADGPFMQFTDIGAPNLYGSFPMLRSLFDSNARADMLYSLNATSTPWAGMTGGDHYLPQVVDQLEDGETAEFNIRGGRLIGGGFNALAADRPLAEFALSRDESGHLHIGDLELRDFRGAIVFPAGA